MHPTGKEGGEGAFHWVGGWGVIINYGNEQSQLKVPFEFGLTGLR